MLTVAAALLVAGAPAPAAPPCAALCQCRADHLACDAVPFHRFPHTGECSGVGVVYRGAATCRHLRRRTALTPGRVAGAGVRHVAVSAARLGALGEAALDARPLRTLVLVASHLHHIDHAAFTYDINTYYYVAILASYTID